ncbi:MAG: DUF3857 domain-containing protein [Bacteroidetes bacterium]|nr:DUF3857 domain-containing protein [Bacteroidota bacterium]
MKLFLCTYFLATSVCLWAQNPDFSIKNIPDSLKINANAIIRFEQNDIRITSQRNLFNKLKRVVSVFNEKGMAAINAVAFYDNRQDVNFIEAKIYDESGNEQRKFKKRDFRDQSVYDGFSIALDGRVLFLDYTPPKYPFTVVFECETQSSNTAFIPSWQPVSDFYLGIEKCIFNIYCPKELGLHIKEANLKNFNIQKNMADGLQTSYVLSNLPAQKREDYSVSTQEIYPWVMFGIENFNLEKIDGLAKNWDEFGQWYYNKILKDTDELPEETKVKVRNLTSGVQDPLEKAKIIYNYVQQKTRYVSIQLGIGGWRPMPAKDVDRLGYGDCKALTNYTKSLLDAVDVKSYHTLLFAGENVAKNIESDIVSIQGNHMMLAIPYGDKYIWLECTSATTPFGYQANFSDNRKVLVVKPNQSEIVNTKSYLNADNSQRSSGTMKINEKGDVFGDLSMISSGANYDKRYRVSMNSSLEQEKHYKHYFDYINSLKIDPVKFVNNKAEISLTENIHFSATKYADVIGNRMMVPVNLFNRFSDSPKRIRNRKTPFEFSKGFSDFDQIKIELPDGYALESNMQPQNITNKFGTYQSEIKILDEKHLLFTRAFSVNQGRYENTQYEECRLFLEQVVKLDQSKIVLTKK